MKQLLFLLLALITFSCQLNQEDKNLVNPDTRKATMVACYIAKHSKIWVNQGDTLIVEVKLHGKRREPNANLGETIVYDYNMFQSTHIDYEQTDNYGVHFKEAGFYCLPGYEHLNPKL